MINLDQLDSPLGRLNLVTQLPQTPEAYYGAFYNINSQEWKGGEIVYHNGTGTGGNKLYIQTATSGRTPTWRALSTQFATHP